MPAHPFSSQAQWRMFFARARKSPKWRKWAHEKAHATWAARGGPKLAFHSLPKRTGGPSLRTLHKAVGKGSR